MTCDIYHVYGYSVASAMYEYDGKALRHPSRDF
jgi:hypothetical protein